MATLNQIIGRGLSNHRYRPSADGPVIAQPSVIISEARPGMHVVAATEPPNHICVRCADPTCKGEKAGVTNLTCFQPRIDVDSL